MSCFGFLARKQTLEEAAPRPAAESKGVLHQNSKFGTSFNDRRLVFDMFHLVDGTGNTGEHDGRLAKEEFKAFLHSKNQERSEHELDSKVEEVSCVLLATL